ncbi:O-methyltransferase domain [Dillenia turbinata]|uniref:O-methyltransferase domain n=1 Tax=Dillenia turbinata TaxID=194707 RepID=A0AAN8WD20_9MAGN
MGESGKEATRLEELEEAQAEVDIWKYVFGYTEIAAVKCAIELGIPDVLEGQEHPVTLSQLCSILNCSPSFLYRIMRFLVHCNVFKQQSMSDGSIGYVQTPISRRMTKSGDRNMTAFILLEGSPPMLAPWHGLSSRVLANGSPAFKSTHGEDVWSYAAANPAHSELIDNAMACDARVAISAIVNGCPEIFEGISTLVDVGGGNGTALGLLVKAFPWIKGINFDLPHVASVAPARDGITHVGGDMFKSVPQADAAFIMWVLHDWGDDECIEILKRCREAIPKEKGKVIIVEAVVNEGDREDDMLEHVRLMLDMVMMAHTNKGKERTLKEWENVILEAGFTHYTVKSIPAVQSVIEAYP